MAEMRKSCCKRRSVIKYIFITALTLFERFFKDIVFFPESEDRFLHFRKFYFWIDWFIQNILRNSQKKSY